MDIFHSELADKWRGMLDAELQSLTVEEAIEWYGLEILDHDLPEETNG